MTQAEAIDTLQVLVGVREINVRVELMTGVAEKIASDQRVRGAR